MFFVTSNLSVSNKVFLETVYDDGFSVSGHFPAFDTSLRFQNRRKEFIAKRVLVFISL